jgi:hypothetical protein
VFHHSTDKDQGFKHLQARNQVSVILCNSFEYILM